MFSPCSNGQAAPPPFRSLLLLLLTDLLASRSHLAAELQEQAEELEAEEELEEGRAKKKENSAFKTGFSKALLPS